MPAQVPNVRTYFVMLAHPGEGDKAMVTAMFASGNLSTKYVEFSTRFENGRSFDTMNSKVLNAFPPSPGHTRTQVPSVQDPVELYRLHCYVMARGGTDGRKIVYGETDALTYLAGVMVESYEKQVKNGILYRDAAGSVYRPTLRGAFWMTWGLLQPMKAFREQAVRSRERQILAELRSQAAAPQPAA